jgi:CheY-like chemotaxis protein
MLSICYVDDDPIARRRFAERLSGGRVIVQSASPPGQLNIEPIIRAKPDILLIDYVLTKPETGRAPVSYQGGTLASRIREAFPDHPVVLLTRESLLAKREYREIRDVMPIFDEVVYKGDIEKDPGSARSLLASMAEGFARLRDTKAKSWKSLIQLLRAPPEAEDALRRAGAPLASEAHRSEAKWRVQEAARWIRGVVLAYPGILYDNLHTATALGIAVESFGARNVRKVFAPAEYRGLFGPREGRWWRVRLYDVAQRVIAAARFSGPANAVFADAYRKRTGTRLRPARCIFSNTIPADWVCYVLQKPVKRQYSLAYHPDDRPGVMDEARVSFKAIREDNRVLDELFDEQGQKLLKEIRKSKGWILEAPKLGSGR